MVFQSNLKHMLGFADSISSVFQGLLTESFTFTVNRETKYQFKAKALVDVDKKGKAELHGEILTEKKCILYRNWEGDVSCE